MQSARGLCQRRQSPRGRRQHWHHQLTKFGELVVLAVKGTVALDALHAAGAANLVGKTVIDATNPIADAPPVASGAATVETLPLEPFTGWALLFAPAAMTERTSR